MLLQIDIDLNVSDNLTRGSLHRRLQPSPIQLIHGEEGVDVVGVLLQDLDDPIGIHGCLGLFEHPLHRLHASTLMAQVSSQTARQDLLQSNC